MSDTRVSKKQKPYAGKIDISGLFGSVGESFSNVDDSPESKQILQLERIQRKSEQVRRYFAPEKMEQLIYSVKAYGILENLVVRPLADNSEKYELVAGERRYRAAVAAGLTEVPVKILNLTDTEALQIALVENLQREDLNPVEETDSVLQLLAIRLERTRQEVISLLYQMQNSVVRDLNHNVVVQDEKVIVKEIFDALGLMSWQSFVKHRLPLLNLPIEILEALQQGKIAYTKAQIIARVKDELQRQVLLKAAISENLSLTQIKERIANVMVTSKSADNNPPSLKNRMDIAYRLAKKTKIWDDPKSQKRLEKLVTELEKLVSVAEK